MFHVMLVLMAGGFGFVILLLFLIVMLLFLALLITGIVLAICAAKRKKKGKSYKGMRNAAIILLSIFGLFIIRTVISFIIVRYKGTM